MKRKLFSFFLACAVLAAFAPADADATTGKKHKRSSAKTHSSQTRSATAAAIASSANGWIYVNREWVHPDGYKFVNGQILRTTAKTGRPAPRPPGKLALDNAQQLASRSNTAPTAAQAAETAAVKAAAERAKPWTRPAPQTGTNL